MITSSPSRSNTAFLPDLQHLELSRNELQLLFDLGKEHLAGPGFLLIAEGEFDALAQQWEAEKPR